MPNNSGGGTVVALFSTRDKDTGVDGQVKIDISSDNLNLTKKFYVDETISNQTILRLKESLSLTEVQALMVMIIIIALKKKTQLAQIFLRSNCKIWKKGKKISLVKLIPNDHNS